VAPYGHPTPGAGASTAITRPVANAIPLGVCAPGASKEGVSTPPLEPSAATKQNSGNDGKRDWPARFYRQEVLAGHSSMDDKVGLLSWRQQEAKAG